MDKVDLNKMMVIDLKIIMVFKRIRMFFMKKHKRHSFMIEAEHFINGYAKEIALEGLNEYFDMVNYETDGLFKEEFLFYKLFSYGKNAMFVDNLQPDFTRSVHTYNRLLKKVCVIDDYVKMMEERKINEILSKYL